MYSKEQQLVLEKFRKRENIFMTGPGGTGKTFIIKTLVKIYNDEMISKLNKKEKHIDGSKEILIDNNIKHSHPEIQVCALTGCAAILLNCNATTVHSFSGIGLANNSVEAIVEKICTNHAKKTKWKRIKCLIIDEVSMLSLKIFLILDLIGRKVKSRPMIPFGGIQIICSGDFFQLPPVGNDNEPDTMMFCFESPIWNEVFPKDNQIILRTNYRQVDNNYINILNRIRIGKIRRADIACLEQCLTKNKNNTNDAVLTKILPRRADVEFINRREYNKLNPESEKIYKTSREATTNTNTNTNTNNTNNTIDERQYEYEYEYLSKNIMPDQEIRIRIGTMVMCIINLDIENQIVNGSQGKVIGFNETGFPIIKFNNGVIKPIIPYSWKSERIDNVSVKQIPLIYAWAITIHKAQGLSLDTALIDIGTQIFEYGQTYVALSRIRSLEGLYLHGFDYKKIKVNPIVKNFYEMLENSHNEIVLSNSLIH